MDKNSIQYKKYGTWPEQRDESLSILLPEITKNQWLDAVDKARTDFLGKSTEWHCEYCDALNKLDRVICVECGAPIPRRKRTGKVCDYCGLPKMTPDKSCRFCGSSSFSVKMQEVAWWHIDRPPCEFSIEYRLPCNDVRFNFDSMVWEQFFEDEAWRQIR